MNIVIDLKEDHSEKVHYDNAEYPIYIRRSFLSAYPSYAAPPHWHDDIEFLVVISGKLTYNVNGELIELNSDEGIFVNSRQMHFGYSKTYEECEFVCVLLHPMALCLTPDMERSYVLPVLENADIPFIHLTNVKWHQDIAEGIRNIHNLKTTPAASLKIQSIFTWIWALIFENGPKYNGAEQVCRHDLSILKSMISFIQNHFNEKITLEQIASAGGIGQSKCCKLFGSYINQTPVTYLIAYRLSKSTELLKISDLNITEISYEIGFNSPSNFAKTFKHFYHCTPREYRNLNTDEH